jgi:hypothetical protein
MTRASKGIGAAITASVLAIGITGQSRAQVTSLSSSGPGGTVPVLQVDPNHDDGFNNAIDYIADFTSLAPITINVGVNSPGDYPFGQTIEAAASSFGIMMNSTGSLWTAIDISLIGAPAGSKIQDAGSAGPNQGAFGFGVFFSPDLLTAHYAGPPGVAVPGVAAGASFEPGVDFTIGGTGPTTFSIQLLPHGTAVPEPGSALLLALGLAGVAALTWRRARPRA